MTDDPLSEQDDGTSCGQLRSQLVVLPGAFRPQCLVLGCARGDEFHEAGYYGILVRLCHKPGCSSCEGCLARAVS